MRTIPWLIAFAVLSASLRAQGDVSVEYQVKAEHLHNFVKFVEWPEKTTDPLLICVAGRNPFGPLLEETVRNETVNGRPLHTRVILEPDQECDVVFVPRGAATSAYLRASSGRPVLTVGEEGDFIAQGGIISMYLDPPNVKFTINPSAANRVNLRISSRLLQLARIVDDRGETQ